MNLFEYLSENWFVGGILCFCAMIFTLSAIIAIPHIILNHFKIMKHGYPPPHCDADGDFKEEEQ